MRLLLPTILSGLFAAMAFAQATDVLPVARVGQVAVRAELPEMLTPVAKREIDRTIDFIKKKDIDAALAHWREFQKRRTELGGRFDPRLYIDYVLNRLAAARDPAVNAASRKLSFYDRQETAVTEHLATVDKQISAYGGADNPEVPLREPQLSDYAEGVEPVTFPAGAPSKMPQLKESLRRWNDKLPEISRKREAAMTDFDRALRANAALIDEIAAIEKKLHAAVGETK